MGAGEHLLAPLQDSALIALVYPALRAGLMNCAALRLALLRADRGGEWRIFFDEVRRGFRCTCERQVLRFAQDDKVGDTALTL